MNNFARVVQAQVANFIVDSSVYWNKRGETSLLQSLLYVLTCHGWHIMFWFRLGKIIYALPIPIVSHILKILFQINWFLITSFYGIWLDLSNNIGKGYYIGHFGGIIIRGDFGDFCSVGQSVTIGTKGVGKSNGYPIFGDNIYVGTGAKVIGNLTIGSHSRIGSNCVVIKSIPEYSRAVGVPAIVTPLNANEHNK
jgi:serine O-acetyltransferase